MSKVIVDMGMSLDGFVAGRSLWATSAGPNKRSMLLWSRQREQGPRTPILHTTAIGEGTQGTSRIWTDTCGKSPGTPLRKPES
jgi:hypothetical protein